jgi:hypothetical protein
MRKIVLMILVFSSAFFFGMSQGIYHHPSVFFAPSPGLESYFSKYQKKDLNQNIRFSFDVGASFSNIGGFGSVFTNYLSPQINYPLSGKINLQIGGIIATNYLAGSGLMIPDFNGTLKNSSFSQYLFYTKGVYQLNDKIKIRSSVIKSIDNTPDIFKMNSYPLNMNYENYSIGFDYKISNSVRFGATFNLMNSRNPYFSSPFDTKTNVFSPYYNPFYQPW